MFQEQVTLLTTGVAKILQRLVVGTKHNIRNRIKRSTTLFLTLDSGLH